MPWVSDLIRISDYILMTLDDYNVDSTENTYESLSAVAISVMFFNNQYGL